jgi:hypothetical protein
MYRHKANIGRRLHARTPPNQRTEAKIGCNVLNRMTSLGMPISVRIKRTKRRREELQPEGYSRTKAQYDD